MEQGVIKSRVIGVDISVRKTTIAIVGIRGNIIASDSMVTSDFPSANEFAQSLSEKIIMLAESNGGYETIRSIGISAPSANYLTGCIENAANLPWKGIVPLSAMLRDRMGIAVALANDAHVAALGEHSFGVAHGMKNFAIVSLGHGIGSCIFTNDSAHLGANGFAGEWGHTFIVPNGRLCGCGRRGCLEAYCAHKGIITTAKEIMEESSEPSLMRSLDNLTPITIEECCEKGDKLAIETYRRTGETLGIGIANVASLIDPEAIVLTGGISHAGHWLFDSLYEAFDEHVYINIRGKVKLLTSNIDDHEREVLGASVLAWGIPEYSLFK